MSLAERISNGIQKMYEVEDDNKLELEELQKKIQDTPDVEFTKVTIGRTSVYTDLSVMSDAEKELFEKQVKAKKAALYNAAKKEADMTLQTMKNSFQTMVDEAEKTVIKKYYDALRTPTADERAEIEHIVKTYNANNSIDAQRDIKFQNTRDFHLKNETAKAFVYCMASIEIYGDEKELPMFDTVENGLPNYGVMPDEWLKVINPEVLLLKDELKDVLEAKRLLQLYEYYQIVSIDKTRRNAYFDGQIREFDNLEAISAKTMISALGGDANATRITFA